jgi:hypothetical protein
MAKALVRGLAQCMARLGSAVGRSSAVANAGRLRIPALTLFALDERKNQRCPYFLARIIRRVGSLADAGDAQAIVPFAGGAEPGQSGRGPLLPVRPEDAGLDGQEHQDSAGC